MTVLGERLYQLTYRDTPVLFTIKIHFKSKINSHFK